MFRLRHFLPSMVAAAAILAGASSAKAGYAVRVFDDGVLAFEAVNGVTTVGSGSSTVSGNSLTFNTSTSHFDIASGHGTSNNPGNQNFGRLSLSGGAEVSANFASGSHNVEVLVSQTDFSAPVGTPVTLSTAAGGSGFIASVAGNSVTATGSGFLDNSNTLFGTPAAGKDGTLSATNTAASINGLPQAFAFTPGTVTSSSVPGIAPGGKYSMTNDLKLVFNLGSNSSGDSVDISLTTIAAVPAPAGLVLALAGVPCLGIGTWLRRRHSV